MDIRLTEVTSVPASKAAMARWEQEQWRLDNTAPSRLRCKSKRLTPRKWIILAVTSEIAYIGSSGPLRLRVPGGTGVYSLLENGKFRFPDRVEGTIEVITADDEELIIKIYYTTKK